MKTFHNLSLKPYNTMGLDIKSKTMYVIENTIDLQQLWQDKKISSQQVYILGGGSNIVFTRTLTMPVIQMTNKGITIVEQNAQGVRLKVEAGEIWHDVVRWTLLEGYYGLENLAFIPGTMGGAPVQNIGAYGSELLQFFHSLEGLDLETGEFRTLGIEDCHFDYRHSIFKKMTLNKSNSLFGRFIITSVNLFIPTAWHPNLTYKDIQKKMKALDQHSPTAFDLYHWVGEIRALKIPDPKEYGNVGSFFKNPVMSKSQCYAILEQEPSLVYYELDSNTFKISGGSLIEVCGWKGQSVGLAKVSENHALVLINAGNDQQPCTSKELLSLAGKIQLSVLERFGIQLEIEPVLYPDHLSV